LLRCKRNSQANSQAPIQSTKEGKPTNGAYFLLKVDKNQPIHILGLAAVAFGSNPGDLVIF